MSAPSEVKLNWQFGSAEDFAKAVQELKEVFPPDGISTDPQVLDKHIRQADGSICTQCSQRRLFRIQ